MNQSFSFPPKKNEASGKVQSNLLNNNIDITNDHNNNSGNSRNSFNNMVGSEQRFTSNTSTNYLANSTQERGTSHLSNQQHFTFPSNPSINKTDLESSNENFISSTNGHISATSNNNHDHNAIQIPNFENGNMLQEPGINIAPSFPVIDIPSPSDIPKHLHYNKFFKTNRINTIEIPSEPLVNRTSPKKQRFTFPSQLQNTISNDTSTVQNINTNNLNESTEISISRNKPHANSNNTHKALNDDINNTTEIAKDSTNIINTNATTTSINNNTTIGTDSINSTDVSILKNTSTPPNIDSTEEYVINLRQQMATYWKSPAEYALHILFTKFIRHAENKLNLCLQHPLSSEPPIIDILGEGIDPTFDKIIASLGHIARKKPKPVIDAMMFWRKTKSEAANIAAEELRNATKNHELESNTTNKPNTSTTTKPVSRSSTTKVLQRSHTNGSFQLPKRTLSSKSNLNRTISTGTTKLIELQNIIEKNKIDALKADRKSLISIYILCRVLIEIVRQAPQDLDEDINDKLEEIVFTQLKITDPISISSSVIKSSNWNSFAELLGCMSEKKFLSVSDRFISELEKLPSHIPQELEPNIHLLILGMRYIRLQNYPLESFEESADFMKSLAKFFAKTENTAVRLAYAEVINQLLLTLTGSLSAEVNHPTWVETMGTFLSCSKKLLVDSKYWAVGFKLTVSIFCASPPKLFSEQWMDFLMSNVNKIKTKKLDERVIFAVGTSRMVWIYLYRVSETLNNTIRTLTKLVQLFLNPKKKENWLTTDFAFINPLSDSLVSIGYLFPEFLLDNAIVPLIKQSFNGNNIENINYEKLLLAITTYKNFLMTSEEPPFPENDNRVYEMNLNKITIKPADFLYSIHEEVCLSIYKLFFLLDSNIGSEVWSPENQHQKQPSTPFGSFTFSFSNDNDLTAQKNNLNIMLFATVIETLPCCLSVSKNIAYKSTIEILTRNAVHANPLIVRSSRNALKALASKKNPYTFITWFAKYSFDFDEKTQSSYNMSYLSSSEYSTLLLLYVELLECWLKTFQYSKTEETKKTIGLDGIQLSTINEPAEEVTESEKLEWKNVSTVIEEVEGNGLFFLCSYDPSVRKLAIRILEIISKFDEAMAEKAEKIKQGHSRIPSLHFAADRGNRLIDFMNDVNIISLISSQKNSLSDAERTRLLKLNTKFKKGLLVKLAESSYGIDAALWQRAFPKLLITIFQSSPVTMALCRSIVCIRLVQVHQLILTVANDTDSKQLNIASEIIINQWKLYLIAACTSLTSVSDQKLHIPSATYQHGRKKSQQIFTVQHQKIKSAKSIFKMVLPLLSSKQPAIREAIIAGLSSMNVNIFKTYIESIDHFLLNWKEGSSNNQTRIEMFHILTILSKFLKEPSIVESEWILRKLSEFLRHVKAFLELDSIQLSYEYQPLRSYFAEMLARYYSTVKTHPLIGELFPFPARASCFNYLKEWCGYGTNAYISEERYTYMVNKAETSREKTAISAGIEFQRSRLEIIALEAMVVLCSERITETIGGDPEFPIVVSFEVDDLLSWIEALFDSDNDGVRKLGVRALEILLEKNTDNVQLFKDVAIQCISPHPKDYMSVLYYITLCKSVLRLDNLILEEDELVWLGLYGLISDKEDTRTYAVDLLSAVETKLHNSSYTKVFKERLANSSKSVYKSTAIEISTIFVELLSQELCLRIFASLVRILDLFPFEIKRDLLILMVPWVNKFTLKSTDELDTYMVLNNLFSITIDLNNRLPKEVEQLWISLGKGNSFQNSHVCMDFIFKTSINHRNPLFVRIARDVILYLANVPGGLGLTDLLLNNLEPRSMIPDSKHQIMELSDKEGKFSYIANIWAKMNYTGKSVIFSKAQLSIVFLVNVLTDINEFVKTKIPILLNVSICLLDHYVPLIQESAARIICNLIFALAPTHEKSEETVELLRNKHSIWSYDNLAKDRKGSRSPKGMDSLIRNLISIFSMEDNLQNEWQRMSLRWATTCPVRHIACRSFQVFRSLLSFLDPEMLRDMLHRLSNTISDENNDIQSFAIQILMTLNAIMAELDATDLISFPQLFWSLVACLSSIHEQEFIEVLSCVAKFISKIDLDSPDTVQCLVATFPSNWEGRFDGLQHIVMTGLRSANSYDMTIKFLDKLNMLKDSRIIADPESRLLFALISNLPQFLHALDEKAFQSVQNSADALISLANDNNQPSLSRLVDSLAKNKFRSKKDFLSQVTSFISRNYFPKYSAQTLVFLLGLLLNKLDWLKIETLEILKYIFPLVDLSRPEFTGVGADLISPLLRLLLTDFESQALEVLDVIPDVSGNKMDKDILRLSMGNKDVKSNNNATTTLFGLPEESGWSIPMPTMTAATTRHNVHTVFMSCASATNVEEINQQSVPIDDIVEFHQDAEYALNRTETADLYLAPDEKDASLSHMWAELDNLDSFFTKNTSIIGTKLETAVPHLRSDSIDTTRTEQTFAVESAPQIYDNKVSMILNKTLSRTPSNISFKKHLADSFASTLGNSRR